MKIVGASTPGTAPPGTRRISLSPRRMSAPIIRRSAVMRCAASRAAPGSTGRSPRRTRRRPPAGPRAIGPASLENAIGWRMPFAMNESGLYCAMTSAGDDSSSQREERRRDEQHDEDEREDALHGRRAARAQGDEDADRAEARARDDRRSRRCTARRRRRPGSARRTRRPSTRKYVTWTAAMTPPASTRPRTSAARGVGEATRRSKNPPSMSSAVGDPGAHAAEQQRLQDRRGELVVEEAVDLREALQRCASRRGRRR